VARGGAEAEGGSSGAFVQGVGEEVREGEGLLHYQLLLPPVGLGVEGRPASGLRRGLGGHDVEPEHPVVPSDHLWYSG